MSASYQYQRIAFALSSLVLVLAWGCGGGSSSGGSTSPVNHPPTITSSAATIAKVGHPYSYAVTTSDPDGNSVKLTLQQAPAGATLSGTTVSWTPGVAETGSAQAFTLTASDGQGGAATQTWSVTPSANAAPLISGVPPTSAKQGHPYSYSIATSDADGDPVSLQLTASPAGAVLTGNVLAWTPTAQQAGVSQVFTLTASDGFGGSSTQNWTLTPSGNAIPVITSTAPATAKQGHPYSYMITALDGDGDPISLQLTASPAGAVLTGNTLAWTPSAQQVGVSQSFTLTVSDGFGGSSTQNWTLIPSANAVPMFTSSTPTSAAYGTPYTYILTATDADLDPISYSLLSAPAGAVLSGNTLTWTIQPAESRLNNDFTIQASDGYGGFDTLSWSVTPTGPILISRVLNYAYDQGSASVPQDLSGSVGTSTFEAFVPDGSGGFTTINNFTAGTSGSGQLTGVPPGYYWFKSGSKNYLWTNSSTIDIGYDTYRRPNLLTSTTIPTNLVFNVTSLNPWNSADDLQWTFSNGGFWNSLFAPNFSFSANAPNIGDTALGGATAPWVNNPLMQASQGDSAYLTQLEPVSVGGQAVPVITRVLGPLSIEQTNGVTTTINGAFNAVPQNGNFTLNWARDQFMQFQAQVSSSAVCVLQGLALDAHPGGTGLGWIANTPDLITFTPATLDSTALNLGVVAYGNPYPATWELFLVSRFQFQRAYLAPGATTPAQASGYIETDTTTMPTASSPIVPLISPPRSLTIKPMGAATAVDATQDRFGVGFTPTLSWSAPGLGNPTGYDVFVYQLSASGSITSITYIAQLQCKTNSIQLPPGMLASGMSYFFKVRASLQPGVDYSTGPYRRRLPVAVADAFTGIMAP